MTDKPKTASARIRALMEEHQSVAKFQAIDALEPKKVQNISQDHVSLVLSFHNLFIQSVGDVLKNKCLFVLPILMSLITLVAHVIFWRFEKEHFCHQKSTETPDGAYCDRTTVQGK